MILKYLKQTSNENLFGTVFGFIPLFFFWFGRFILCYIQTELQVVMENVLHPLHHEQRPSIGRGRQVGGGFLWTTSFTYRKREKTKDKAIWPIF